MKYLLALLGMVALFGSATLPAQAWVVCPTTTVHADLQPVPPQCALPETKTEHPGWYRDGGYCEGATKAKEVTGSTTENCVSVED